MKRMGSSRDPMDATRSRPGSWCRGRPRWRWSSSTRTSSSTGTCAVQEAAFEDGFDWSVNEGNRRQNELDQGNVLMGDHTFGRLFAAFQ